MPSNVNLTNYAFRTLLTAPEVQPKMLKSLEADGVYTAILHLAPARSSGYQTCPGASPQCVALCLNTAGAAFMMAAKERARIARTRAFFEARPAFMARLVLEIEAHIKKAEALNMRPAIRLNGTSDIRWETVPVIRSGETFPNVMRAFPDLTYYDYTKLSNRRNIPPNYHLTFSLSETNAQKAIEAIDNGMNVAAVFAVTPSQPLPATWQLGPHKLPVIDGDKTDWRPGDPSPCFIGLRAKGKARKAQSGFVQRAA
jgi:hypothetical protein